MSRPTVKPISRLGRVAACALAVALPGCGLIQQKTAGVLTPKRGASLIALPGTALNPTQEVGDYYAKSFTECMNFKEGLLSATAGINAGSDYATLILSALATVIAPIGTVHLLTAGATATTGFKSTFANDVAAGTSIDLTIAFDKIYFQPMATLAETTLSAPIPSGDAPGVIAQIVSLQEQCSLDEAQAYINQNLSQGSARKPTGQLLEFGRNVPGRQQ